MFFVFLILKKVFYIFLMKKLLFYILKDIISNEIVFLYFLHKVLLYF